jgi:hypothetical protein
LPEKVPTRIAVRSQTRSPIFTLHYNTVTYYPSLGTGGFRGTILKSILIASAIVASAPALAFADARQPNGF